MRQDNIRNEFTQWLEDNDYPTIRRVTERIGINYIYFMHWRAGRKNFSDEKLKKVINHIRK